MNRLFKAATVAVGVIAFSAGLHAETGVGFTGDSKVKNPLQPSATGLKGIFSAEKFDTQQTIGVSFGTGANRFSQYYLNTMTYRVSEPLTIQATLGIHNQSLGRDAYGGGAGGARIVVPNVGILYQPRPNLRIEVGFSNAPGYGYDPFGRDTFWGRRGY